MNRTGNYLVIGIVALLAIGAIIAALAVKNFSIAPLGDEGYEPYDPSLAAGSFDQSKWFVTNVTCAGLGGTRASQCAQIASTPYAGLSVKDGNLIHSAVPYTNDADQPTLRTTDLRLVNFKTEFQLFAGGKDGGTVCWYGYCYTATGGRDERRSTSPSATLELLWDDYETGHYQIKVNNRVVQDGNVSEGTPFYLTNTPTSRYGNEWYLRGELSLSNPRIKRLFDCDPQAGEVEVHTCTSGPANLTVQDLKGFKRFCPSLPATFSNAGLTSSSKRVYYALAQGKTVTITKDQIWEFHYLADGKAFKTPPDKTGLVELCKGPVLIDDLQDFPVTPPVITGNTLQWTSYGRFDGTAGYKTKKTDLTSGEQVFMSTTPVKIDEDLCPYASATQSYPGLPPQCFTVQAFGKTFHDTERLQVSDGMNVTLESLGVQFRRDDMAGDVFSWTARWKLTFGPESLTQTIPTTNDAPLGSNETVLGTLSSALPGPGTYATAVTTKSVITGETIQDTLQTAVRANSDTTFLLHLPTDTLGEHHLTSLTALVTEAGNVPLATNTISYNVTSTTTTTAPEGSSSHWWNALWEWIVALFTYTEN